MTAMAQPKSQNSLAHHLEVPRTQRVMSGRHTVFESAPLFHAIAAVESPGRCRAR